MSYSNKSIILPILFLVFLGISMLGGMGCDLIYPFDPYEPENENTTQITQYKCFTPLNRMGMENKELPGDVKVEVHRTVTEKKVEGVDYLEDKYERVCGEWRPPKTGASKIGPKGLVTGMSNIYCDSNIALEKINYKNINGSGWIATTYANKEQNDLNNEAMEYQITFPADNSDFTVYLACDTRICKKIPSSPWLPGGIGTIIPDALVFPKSTLSVPRSMDLYKVDMSKLIDHIIDGKTVKQLILPGTSYGINSTSTPVDVLPHLIIVKPKEKVGNHIEQPAVASIAYNSCDDCDIITDLAAAKKHRKVIACTDEIKTEFLQKMGIETSNLEQYTCGEPICTSENTCPDCTDIGSKKSGLHANSKSYIRRSVIRFGQKPIQSKATITVDGNKVNGNVDGFLDFNYHLTGKGGMETVSEIQIDDFVLHVDKMNTGAGTFTNTVVSAIRTDKAKCKDPNPPFRQPCAEYSLDPGTFGVGIVSDRGEKDKFFGSGSNIASVPILIDHKNRTFTLPPFPFSGAVQTDDGPLGMTLVLDLHGYFENFSPQASAIESDRHSECDKVWIDKTPPVLILGNKTALRLTASTSFELYGDALPAKPDNFLWYEDYGLVTERFLGKGENLILPPGTLGYGVHDITLFLQDSHGVADTDQITVSVTDTLAPKIDTPKQQIHLLRPEEEKRRINLAPPEAEDECAAKVSVMGIGLPDNNLFGPGIWEITWRADDGHGNTIDTKQKITVMKAKEPSRRPFNNLRPTP